MCCLVLKYNLLKVFEGFTLRAGRMWFHLQEMWIDHVAEEINYPMVTKDFERKEGLSPMTLPSKRSILNGLSS